MSSTQGNRTSLVAQLVKNLPAMQETWVQSLGWEDPLEKGTAIHSSILAWRIPWTVHGVAKSWTRLSGFHFSFFCVTYALLSRRSLTVMTDENMTENMKQIKGHRPLDLLWTQRLAASFVT